MRNYSAFLKAGTVLLLFLSFNSKIWSQCADPTLVNSENILSVGDPYQFTFLHEIPKNRVDSLLAVLMDPKSARLTDKAATVEAIAATRSHAAFLLLWVSCLRPQVMEDMSPFGTLSATIVYYNGHQLLNRYFLNNKVDAQLPPYPFFQEVMRLCAKKNPKANFCTERNREFGLLEIQSRIDAAFNEYNPCDRPERVTASNIYHIHNPYEFTFLHRIPQNGVDSFVLMLRYGPLDTNTRHALRKMAETRSHEAFLFLFACAAVADKSDIVRNIFHSIANQVNIWGGYIMLNRYFLDSAVTSDEYGFSFHKEVLALCWKKDPEMYYCHQPTTMEIYEAEMAGVNPTPYDRQIIRIIRKHSNLNKVNQGRRIEQEVLQLPFVEDVLWDGCYEKLCIYPPYYSLMVVMNIGGKKVEREYAMLGARFRYIGIRLGECRFGRSIETNKNKLVIRSLGYSPGTLAAARRYCQEKEREP